MPAGLAYMLRNAVVAAQYMSAQPARTAAAPTESTFTPAFAHSRLAQRDRGYARFLAEQGIA